MFKTVRFAIRCAARIALPIALVAGCTGKSGFTSSTDARAAGGTTPDADRPDVHGGVGGTTDARGANGGTSDARAVGGTVADSGGRPDGNAGGEPGDARAACETGAKCDAAPPPCVPGDLGCSCADGACTGGECVGGTCIDCSRGAEGCRCMNNAACDAGQACREGVCAPCPAGERDCPCLGGDQCADTLVCLEGVCSADACPEGTDGCPCTGGVTCVTDDLVCGGDGLCRPCSNDMEGCPCVGGVCEVALVCDPQDQRCRAETTCAEAGCAPHRRCDERGPGEDALCLDACDEGFTFSAGDCQPVVSHTCVLGAPDGTGDACVASHRLCVEDVPGDARCGNCVAGYVDDLGQCRLALGCVDRGCEGQNRACVEAVGIDAVCGACLPGYAAQGNQCLANLACDQLDCAALHRTCGGAPPRCGTCDAGFIDVAGACEPAPSCDPAAPNSRVAECAALDRECIVINNEAVCGECVQGTLQNPDSGLCEEAVRCDQLPCEGLGRVCINEPFAECGACAAGTRPVDAANPLSACVPARTCADTICPANEFCVEGAGLADASCVRSRCGPGAAFRLDTNECVACANLLCGEVGETGNVWPVTQQFSDDCLCETQTGYYWDAGGAVRALPCDQDNDGWVRSAAYSALNSSDQAVLDNARCALRKIDRITLKNELGQEHDVRSCFEAWVDDPSAICPVEPVALYESTRNDDPDTLALDIAIDAPNYAQGGVGRQLRAAELNPLTKACLSVSADYNDDHQSDAGEYQDAPPAADLEAALRPFLGFSYFIELHRGYYRAPPDGQSYGSYVIEERSRCDASFPLAYSATEGEYGRECSRNRDALYTNDTHTLTPVGFDFAQFGCGADRTGSCELQPPVAEAGLPDTVPPHGLCELATLPPADGLWRGMNHHSQFKCVVVSGPADLPADRLQAPQRVAPSELYDGADNSRAYQFNRCHVACPVNDPDCRLDCPPGADCTESSSTPGGLANPSRPVITCAAVPQSADGSAIPPRSVGFAAVRYVPSAGDYARGCIDEWNPSLLPAEYRPWKALCPGQAENPSAVVGVGNPQNFGRSICGCGLNYGGPSCSIGCPRMDFDANGDGVFDTDVGPLSYGGPAANVGPSCVNGYCPVATDGAGGGRRGYWACGGFTATSWEPPANDATPRFSGGAFEVRGGVSLTPFASDRLCQDASCDTGFSIRKSSVVDRDRQ